MFGVSTSIISYLRLQRWVESDKLSAERDAHSCWNLQASVYHHQLTASVG